ncbi:MAG: hypothetical protein ISQ22_00540 [Rhizobiales bacterium]|nr:hypothetical protein [Hyphomicrobiales bacterium]MBL6769853.1 hypothetical protein [Hyphomicrobiales bacterium]
MEKLEENLLTANEPDGETCPFCNSNLGFVYVQSHYQCLNCKQVTDPCCGGECEYIQND